jgi:outer membrane receptor protein involved in Fe transport
VNERFLPALGAALLTSLAAAPRARADGDGDLARLLEEPVVSAVSKKSEVASAAPATVTVISSDDLRRHGIHTLAEALSFLSLGMMTESNQEQTEVNARGVLITGDYGSHVLLLLNGHAINEPWAGASYVDHGAAIPFEIIDHIEVILGPGSVLYGSNAMLGVINVVTKSASDFGGVHGVVESELPVSIRGAAGVGKEFTFFGKPAEVTAMFEYYASRGPNFAVGPQVYGNDSVSGAPKRFSFDGSVVGTWRGNANDTQFSQVPSAFARLVVGDFELNARAALYKRWSPFTIGYDDVKDPGYELDRWVSLDARYHTRVSAVAQISVRLYGDLYDYTDFNPEPSAEDCLAGQNNGCNYRLVGGSKWVGTELQTALDWFHDGRFGTLLGVDGRLRDVYQSRQDYTDATTGVAQPTGKNYDHFEQGLGAYVEQTVRPLAWLALNAGARLDADGSYAPHFSPRAGVAVSPWHGGSLKLTYAEAFRAPSAYERFETDGLTEIHATSLAPEIVRSVEASFEQRVGAHRFFFGLFRSWWDDLITLAPATAAAIAAAHASGELSPTSMAVSQFQNTSSIQNYGVNVALEGTAITRRLRYGLNATGAFTRNDAGDGNGPILLPAAAQLFGNARISYDLGGSLPVLALVGRVAGARNVAGSSYAITPQAPPLAELRAAVSGPVPFVPRFAYRVSANYNFTSSAPYAAGPLLAATPQNPTQQLTPLDRFRVTVGLSYDLPF